MKSALSDFISGKKGIYGILHIIILVMSLFLVISISVDTFKGIPFYTQSSYMKVQLCICLWFLFDFVLEFFLAKHKGRYLRTHFIFLLVAIPYQNIIAYYGWTFSDEITYLLRFIPLLRGGYALAIVVGWLTYNRASSLFVSYLTMLLATVYFSSLAFFVLEHRVNPLVNGYGDALGFYGCHYRRFEYHSADGDRTCTFRFVGCLGYDDVPYLYSLYHKSDSAI
jgi:hypothetical protein